MDAANVLCDMRRKAPATVTVNTRGRTVAYATLWDERQPFTRLRADGLVYGLEYYTTIIMAVVSGGSRGSTQLLSRLARL